MLPTGPFQTAGVHAERCTEARCSQHGGSVGKDHHRKSIATGHWWAESSGDTPQARGGISPHCDNVVGKRKMLTHLGIKLVILNV